MQPFLSSSLLGKAQDKGLISIRLVQIRDFSKDKHRTVDDTPFGGGEGMLLKVDVLYDAWKSAAGGEARGAFADQEIGAAQTKAPNGALTLLLSPQGPLFSQPMAKDLVARYSKFILVCGHYEGVDERFIELCVDGEVSIGDYVLTGGELPAAVMIDAMSRLIPGVVKEQRSVSTDSLEGGLLKYPQYTRPREFQGREVPEVLLSGDHKAIAKWREKQSEERTRSKRPDLWSRRG